MIRELERLVRCESPTFDVFSMDAAISAFLEILEGLKLHNLEAIRHPREDTGGHTEIRLPGTSKRRPILVVGHLDTVHPIGSLARNPFKIENDRAFGPGTCDMKGGLVILVEALRILSKTSMPAAPITILVTSDEEEGSPSSLSLLQEIAGRSACALILEPSGDGGALKTKRKGFSRYLLTVLGRSAHSGNDFELGRNAILGLSNLLPSIAALGNAMKETTVNVGRIEGGKRAGVVPDRASCEIDVRFWSRAEARRIDTALRQLATAKETTLEGGINRLAMRTSAADKLLIEQARSIGTALGISLNEASVGGASDGNITSGLGLPTLDGLGAVGSCIHTDDEYVSTTSLPERAALLASLLLSV